MTSFVVSPTVTNLTVALDPGDVPITVTVGTAAPTVAVTVNGAAPGSSMSVTPTLTVVPVDVATTTGGGLPELVDSLNPPDDTAATALRFERDSDGDVTRIVLVTED